jgi:uncharacterized protein YegL
MSVTQINESDALKRAEKLLVQELSGQDATLQELQEELGSLREDQESPTIERMFQWLATSVGKQSKINA